MIATLVSLSIIFARFITIERHHRSYSSSSLSGQGNAGLKITGTCWVSLMWHRCKFFCSCSDRNLLQGMGGWPLFEVHWSRRANLAFSDSCLILVTDSDVGAQLSLKAAAWAQPERAHGSWDGQTEPKPSDRAGFSSASAWAMAFWGTLANFVYNLVYTCANGLST